LASYIALRYAGRGELFVSPPCHPELSSNAPSPSDLDYATYIKEEENDLRRNLLRKKQDVLKIRKKAPEQKLEK